MAHTILHEWKERDKKANKPKKKKKEVSAAQQQAASRKGWKYGDIEDTENYMYMGRVPDTNAKKNIGRPPELKESQATVRAWAPIKKATGGSVGFQKRLKEGTVRKAHDKKLEKRASSKKKKEDKEKRLSDAIHTANIESAIQKKQVHKTALKGATEQDDWSMKPSSPLGKYMEHYSAKNKLDDIRKRERMDDPSYKSKMSTRPDKERGRKSGGYVKKYAKGGGVRKART